MISSPIPLLGIYPKEFIVGSPRDICTSKFTAELFTNSQEVKAPQVSTDERMDKQNMVCTYNRILCGLKKEGNPVTCYNMDEP